MRIEDMLNKAATWLLNQQDKHTGGWSPYYGGAVSALNTAEVIVALLDIDRDRYTYNPQVSKGLDFLEASRCDKGENKGAWLRSVPRADEKVTPQPDIIRTSFAIQALIRTGRGLNQAAQEGLDWIIKVRNAQEAGWGYRQSDPVSIMSTCFALLSLIDATKRGVRDYTNIIDSGVRCLIKFRDSSGSFSTLEDRQKRLEAMHTIYVILVFQAIRDNQIEILDVSNKEEDALDWLMNNSKVALDILEDRIAIDGIDGCTNYNFLYLADTLITQVMRNAKQDKFRDLEKNTLARKALEGLMHTSSIEGGFYSPRLMSWATAKAITSLKKSELKEFPIQCTICRATDGKTDRDNTKEAGRDIIIFLIVIVAGVIGLNIFGIFTPLTASIFIMLSLIALAAYGKITDKSLGEAIKFFFKSAK
ncbi:terpene cyclase/mutase family protein [Desulfobulbus sp. F4]|nr:terpene cyclase/mutase family protein [Desulfobulbus sp. F4]